MSDPASRQPSGAALSSTDDADDQRGRGNAEVSYVPWPANVKLTRWQRIIWSIEFMRHVPVRKIARRGALTIKRRMLERFARKALPGAGVLKVREGGVASIMPRRLVGVEQSGSDVRITLLGRSEILSRPLFASSKPTAGNGSQLWSMSLHYMEYLEGCDDATFVAIVEDWLDGAAPYGRSYWRDVWNSYTVSLRIAVWLQQLAIRPDLPAELKRRMYDSLAGQLSFLERNLETDIGGNHLVKNVKALLLGGCAFDGAAAVHWRRRGLRLLESVIAEQILPDGFHFERSCSYHAQVFVDLLECRAALGHDPLHGRLDDALLRMAQALADLAPPDGGPALFNDAGLTMSHRPSQCLEACARLLGAHAVRQAVFSYPEAGYFGAAFGSDLFVADCGRIGPDALPGHGHGDVLSFEWSLEGQRIIVDQGVYEYVDGARRRLARSTAAHNTLSIEGADQAEFFGDFRVGRRPDVSVGKWQPRTDGFRLEGCHDGFARTAAESLHTRVFEVARDVVGIADRLSRPSRGRARTALLLHPEVCVTASGNSARLERAGVAVEVISSVPLVVAPAAWWPDMGCEFATSRLVADWPSGTTEATMRLAVLRRR